MCKWYLLINANLIKAKQMWAFTVYMKNSLRFEISISIWSIWPKWNSHRSGFHSARSHVNADNEVTSHQTEILSRSEISNRFDIRVYFRSHVNVLLGLRLAILWQSIDRDRHRSPEMLSWRSCCWSRKCQ